MKTISYFKKINARISKELAKLDADAAVQLSETEGRFQFLTSEFVDSANLEFDKNFRGTHAELYASDDSDVSDESVLSELEDSDTDTDEEQEAILASQDAPCDEVTSEDYPLTIDCIVDAFLHNQRVRGYADEKCSRVIQGDLKAGLKFWKRGGDRMLQYTEANIPGTVREFLEGFAALPVKSAKYCSQMLYLLSTGDIYRGVYKTAVIEILAAGAAGVTSRSGLFYSATGRGNESTSDKIPALALVNKIRRAIGYVGTASESTQNSNSFGKNGFALVLGLARMVKPDDGSERYLALNKESPFYVRLCDIIAKSSDASLALALNPKGQ